MAKRNSVKGESALSGPLVSTRVKKQVAEFDRAIDQQTRETLHTTLNTLEPILVASIDQLSQTISQFMEHQGFWESESTAEKIALMHSELSEALEADRKDLEAEHIFGFTGVEEELADVVIRVLDYASYNGLRLGEAIIAKMHYNATRERKHGKKY